MTEGVPLVVPEINASSINAHNKIIANPNCSTIQMVMVLKPLHDLYKIKRVVVSTYQSVTGTGKVAVDQLMNERAGKDGDKAYAHVIDMNLIPQIDVFQSNGYTKEEMKMILETKKIGDYAEEKDVGMVLHFAGTPIGFMANVHSAAATENALALEVPNQIVDNTWWPQLVKTTDGRSLWANGQAPVPNDAPGLGIELNEDVIKEHLHPEDRSFFDPTPQWNEVRSYDRIWS